MEKSQLTQQKLWEEQIEEIEASFRLFDDWDIFSTTPEEYAKRMEKVEKKRRKDDKKKKSSGKKKR
ncbi:hypothetical protein J7K43_01450 [Candidatus Calescamantes bacterium]|nr:hypothetical protein [Candidatus Calescamantes bacterium]